MDDGGSNEAQTKDAQSCDSAAGVADCSNGWCKAPHGCFLMGSPADEFGRGRDDENQVQVTLTHDFAITQHEITQAEWTAYGFPSFANPIISDAGNPSSCIAPNCPASRMTWIQAVVYANRLSESVGLPQCYILDSCDVDASAFGYECSGAKLSRSSPYECEGFRLPTEAEWEYAARAGSTTAFYSGGIKTQSSPFICNDDPNLDPIAWYCANATVTHPVMGKAPNAYGLFDMLGNAGEWVSDSYNGAGYGTTPLVDPWHLPTSDGEIVTRGGVVGIWAAEERCASRFPAPWDATGSANGFRLVRTLSAADSLATFPNFDLVATKDAASD